MGIRGLVGELRRRDLLDERPNARRHGGRGEGRVLGVDAAAIFFESRARSARMGRDDVEGLMADKLLAWLTKDRYACVIAVVDGDAARKEKGRDRAAFSKSLLRRTSGVFALFGCPTLQAPFEAEAALGAMQSKGLVDDIYSHDTDTLMYAASYWNTTYCLSTTDAASALLERPCELREANRFWRIVASLVGNDFVEGGIRRIGLKKAVSFFKAYACALLDAHEDEVGDEDEETPTPLDDALATAFRKACGFHAEAARSQAEGVAANMRCDLRAMHTAPHASPSPHASRPMPQAPRSIFPFPLRSSRWHSADPFLLRTLRWGAFSSAWVQAV